MNGYWNTQLTYIFQLFAAAGCGLVIGLERQARTKLAGIRTHMMVSLAACLMMIISKYGFMDVVSISGISVDASRVAAGIITGIGILGGGLMLTGKQGVISGVTTAAGIWCTVGVGMAMGSEMYLLGLSATAIILAVQVIFHGNLRIGRESWRGQIVAECGDDAVHINKFLDDLNNRHVEVVRSKIEHKDKKCVLHLMVHISSLYSRDEVVTMLAEIPQITSFEM